LLNKENYKDSRLFIKENYADIVSILKKFYFIGLTENKEDFNFVYKLLGISNIVSKTNVSRDFIDFNNLGYLKDEDSVGIRKVLKDKCYFEFELYEEMEKINKRSEK
jgi:hypothetical protein